MVGDLKEYPWEGDYEENPLEDFYIPALERSKYYDRAAGYFSSAVFNLVGVAIARFATNGGKMRLICSPQVTESDREEFLSFRQLPESVIEESLEQQVKSLQDKAEDFEAVRFLSTLISHRVLEIKFSCHKKDIGIFHKKVGIFSDDFNSIAFNGSFNETFKAWHDNAESMFTKRDWLENEFDTVKKTKDRFERYWNDQDDDYKTIPLSEASEKFLSKYAFPSIEEAEDAVIEKYRARQKKSPTSTPSRKADARTPGQHQSLAASNWAREEKGIISFCTGGGKTFTALLIIKKWFEQHKDGSVLVIVPSSLLADQWEQEIELEIDDPHILRVGSENKTHNWENDIPSHTRQLAGVRSKRITIAVVNSAAKDKFLQTIRSGSHLLVVADEVHKIGAPNFRRILEKVDGGGRLGLSATPERYGDQEGTDAIFDYFGEVIEPIFSIRDAQKSDPPRLVEYFYYPNLVTLNAHEHEDYKQFSQKISKLTAMVQKESSADLQKKLNLALIQRANIIKSAENKIQKSIQILKDKYRSGDSWLIYCNSESHLLNLRKEIQREFPEEIAHKYTSKMKSDQQEETLRVFEKQGGFLLSIKCLDEGIDIPKIDNALILASSINPREHIQRRGRVLRTAEGKSNAKIYDLLVAPDPEAPKSVIPNEAERAMTFAADAMNSTPAKVTIGDWTWTTESEPDFEDDISQENL